MQLVESTEVPWYLLKTLDREELPRLPLFPGDTFYVSEEGLMPKGGRQDVRPPFSLPSHCVGWEAPHPSDQAKEAAKSFIGFLKSCRCPPTREEVWMADYWFNASSEATHAYYRLRVECIDVMSWSVVVLTATVHRPKEEWFDSDAIRHIRFLDGVIGSIASACGAQKLRRY